MYDTDAKAIILTKIEKKSDYECLLNKEKNVESSLFHTLTEQLMIEIVLKTVTNINLAINWICSTFLFIRIVKNPAYYHSDIRQNDFSSARPIISKWCQMTMSRLNALKLITMKKSLNDDGSNNCLNNNNIDATYLAKIITRHGVTISTTEKLIHFTKCKYALNELLEQLCACKELTQNVVLRTNEKRFLNELNKKIRFKFKNRFKNNVMKINCLIQVNYLLQMIFNCLINLNIQFIIFFHSFQIKAVFDCLEIETCLFQDYSRIIRSGQRVSKCLMEIFYYLFNLKNGIGNEQNQLIEWNELITMKLKMHFETICSAARLALAFRTKLWFDSMLVARQLPKIGPKFSQLLVDNGYTTFDRLVESNSRDIEFCIKRNPPFGSYLIEEVPINY